MTYQTEHAADDAHARTGYKYKENELTRLRARVERLEAAAKNVPDPENEGYCEACGKRLDLIEEVAPGGYKRHRWKHEGCWYGKLIEALEP